MAWRWGDPDKEREEAGGEGAASLLPAPPPVVLRAAAQHVQVQQGEQTHQGEELHVLQKRTFQTRTGVRMPPLSKEMCKIKRNNKKSKKESESFEELSDDKSDNLSINQELEANAALAEYRNYVKNNVREVLSILKKLETARPELKTELT